MLQVKDKLDLGLASDFVGRNEELDLLLGALSPDGPSVVFLHGIAGSGKSRLLEVFGQQARARKATVIRLDCGGIEPTPAGLLSALAAATGSCAGPPEEIAARLGRVGARVVLMLDTYEVFRLMDRWLRQVLIPLLPVSVRVVLSGREAPLAAWFAAPGWHGLFKAIGLDCLDQACSLEYLLRAGVPSQEARRLEPICRGLPLALTLAASLRNAERPVTLTPSIGQRIIEEISRLYVSDIDDPQTRRALEAACVVRRVTMPLLRAMLPDASPQDAQERIRALPFVHAERDGLHIHDAVREAIASSLRAHDPQQHRAYRKAAHRHFLSELRAAGSSDLWRCTADLLYMLENPVVREAFFPTGAQEYTMEPAQAKDEPEILEIIAGHEPSAMAAPLMEWCRRARETFVVARDRKDAVAGFLCLLDPVRHGRLRIDDPIVRAWMDHLRENPLPRQQRALFLRRWLSAENGESPSPVQAACWIEIKQKYIELRPHLRRVYSTLRDLAPYAPVVQKLGFRVLPGCEPDRAGYSSAILDFGPSSVDGWLARLVASELGVEDDGILDSAARELAVNGRRVALTKLEFGVMQYLNLHRGEAISRTSLLENVWEQAHDGGSNVVDVVIRALRKKLGDRGSDIETVQGLGYRFRRHD